MTVQEALKMHLADMRKTQCAERSVETMELEVRKHLEDWLERPLARVTPEDCRKRHERLTSKNGPYVANRVMRHLRACWNTATRSFPSLPPWARRIRFNKERRRREPIKWPELPGWWEKIHALSNTVRRDLWLFVLFTGLRSSDAKTVRWEHVDLEAGTLHRPKPKGGEDRAFTVPVSVFVLDLLRRRKEENRVLFGDDKGWVWPSRRADGTVSHVSQLKEQKWVKVDGKNKRRTYMPSPHRLRDTFATAGHEARIHPMDLKVLMNHTLPTGNVTEGYIRPSIEHLRESIERVAQFLQEKAEAVSESST